jgi:hypothetical protein
VHNVRNTEGVAAIDDEDCMRVLRLFNENCGREYLASIGIDKKVISNLSLLGISGIGNLLSAIKTAKYFEMNEDDIIFTVFTDSVEMYKSRLDELNQEKGNYLIMDAAKDHAASLEHQSIDFFKELTYYERKAIHNLKYFTWVEQQGKTYEEILAQWNDDYWTDLFENEVIYFDKLIEEFNSLI